MDGDSRGQLPTRKFPLLRCVRCDVFAYHDTVKQLAKNGAYRMDEDEPARIVKLPFWQKLWAGIRRGLGRGLPDSERAS